MSSWKTKRTRIRMRMRMRMNQSQTRLHCQYYSLDWTMTFLKMTWEPKMTTKTRKKDQKQK
jgi:hypothetical protein